MSCLTLTSGICRGCRDNAGGIKTVYMINLHDVTAITSALYYQEDGQGQWDNGTPVDGNGRPITLVDSVTLRTGATWFEFQPNKYSSSYTETINSSIENGNVYYAQVLSLVFGHLKTEIRDVIEELGESEVLVVIENNNGNLFLLGEMKNGMVVSGGSGATGTAFGDLNGYTVELTCNAAKPARELCTVPAPTGPAQAGDTLIAGNTTYSALQQIAQC